MNRHRAVRVATNLAALCLSLVALSLAAVARADNPFETEASRLAGEVSRAGSSPRALIPLIELWQMSDDVRPEVMRRLVDRLANDRRLAPATRAYARAMLATLRLRSGEHDAARRAFDELGFVRDWRVIGPFDNEGKAGFDRLYPPEVRRMEPLDMDARYPGRERPVGWRVYPDVSVSGSVSFDAVFRPNENVCAYAETFVESDRPQPLTVWVGAGGAVRVWWNGEVVHEDGAYRLPHIDRSAAIVGAQRGANRLLVKVCVADRAWGMSVRIGDAQGGPMPRGVRSISTVATEAVAAIPAGHGGQRLPAAPPSALRALEDAARGEQASAQALEDLARLLVYTDADDPAEERARQLAARAAEAQPTVGRLALAARLATQRGVAMGFARRASEIAASDPATLLLQARLASAGPSPELALPILARVPRGSRQWMQASLLAADILDSLGLEETGRMHVEQAAALAPGTARWIGARAGAAGATERRDELMTLRREIVALRWDDLGSRAVLMDDALTRGDAQEVLSHLAVYRRLAADRPRTYVLAAEVLEALGRMDEAFAAYRAGLEVAPEEAGLHVALGQALLRTGQSDAAAASLREALALRPQDAATRELLEQLAPQERLDEGYAAEPATLLARRLESQGHPITVLQDLSVNTVFESGLGSRFHQTAVQIHDEEGARQWRTYSIQFDPDVQRVDVRQARVFRGERSLQAARTFEQPLGEPWYRMYYDTRALVVVFPDLAPGDVVEIRYRIDDVAPRNLFHDYYGDLHYLQRTVPTRHQEYVLITPTSRNFYFNEPRLPSLMHDRRVEGARRIDRFVADDVPAISPEPSMPGMTEIAPYLHVSTYRTWEEVGRWYWGLIRDQLYADESLRRRVRELVLGAPDTRTKVMRIYDWVIRNTRYVALEFGIHGFLPYRVPDIVTRGFGDCKDKASLIYTMLREAGVDARIVLLRTRPNGHIHDLPASLAVFDHAIAYVPELDLYLDGTAEHSGLTDLPQMDQGVTVLRVGPDDVTLAQTPVLPPDANRRVRQVDLRIGTDGAGTVELREELRGVEAPGYRVRFQAEGLRNERLERQMRGLFPGLTLEEASFESLDDNNAPVRLRFRAQVPQLAIRDGRTLRVAPSALGDLSRNLAAASTRRLPLDLGLRSTYVEERAVQVPQGFTAQDAPAGGRADSQFGLLRVDVGRDGRSVTARTELVLRVDEVSAEDYPAFRRWVEEVDRILQQRWILAPTGAPTGTRGGER